MRREVNFWHAGPKASGEGWAEAFIGWQIGACVASGGKPGFWERRLACVSVVDGDPNVLTEVPNGPLDRGGGECAPKAWLK